MFIVGSPRSGTTWVQAVLSHHPSFASPTETYLFDVLGDVQYRHARSAPGTGIGFVLADDQLRRWFAVLWNEIRESLLLARPGATRVLEKTPVHALHMELIRSVVPGARFVLLARNPLDATRSLLEATARWGDEWFPPEIESATTIWHEHVSTAFAASRPEDTLMVRYEDLLTGPEAWRPMLEHVGIESDWVPSDLDAPSLLSHRVTVPAGVDAGALSRERDSLRGFSFHDRQPDHRRELTGFERRYVLVNCADLMEVLGYTDGLGVQPRFTDRIRLPSRRVARKMQRCLLQPLWRLVRRQ